MPGIGLAEQAGVGPDGKPRPSEDVVIVLPHAVILLDGATSLRPDQPSGGWYAMHLAAALAGRLTAAPEHDLADLLAGSIRSLSRQHKLVKGAAPSSTVAVVRWGLDTVDALVLADSPVVMFGTDGSIEVVADDRIAECRSSLPGYRDRLRDGGGYDDEHYDALLASTERTSALRNTEGGFWVAEAEPKAAHQARRVSWDRDDVAEVLIVSDGVSCGVEEYGVFPDWPSVLKLTHDRGPQAVLDAVREAESADPDGRRWPRAKPHDDQALVHLDFREDV